MACDKQTEILAALGRIELLLVKIAAMGSVQIELAGLLAKALPEVDADALGKDIAKVMKKIQRAS